jgi:hypothetical protein
MDENLPSVLIPTSGLPYFLRKDISLAVGIDKWTEDSLLKGLRLERPSLICFLFLQILTMSSKKKNNRKNTKVGKIISPFVPISYLHRFITICQ